MKNQMSKVEAFMTNFKYATSDGRRPFMIRISASLAEDKDLSTLLDITNGRGEFMGVVINVVPDFQVVKTYEDAFPNQPAL